MQNITIYHREPPTEAIKGFQSALFGRQLSRAMYELHTLGFDDEELHRGAPFEGCRYQEANHHRGHHRLRS